MKELLSTAFSLHIIFLVSIFDIYFRSPIIEGINPVASALEKAPAKRLVLIVADGLRADIFFKNDKLVPFLRTVIEDKGKWGVSHTRVPTESRPGHVALLAGFYEDPSCIFLGWKDNLVEFDSVFNRSDLTYAWGSPYILNMFRKDSTKNRIKLHSYSAEFEEFFLKNGSASKLSQWSFDKFHAFFQSVRMDDALEQKLLNNKTIFFVHLLGVDTSGHSHKPDSQEYLENVRLSDEITGKIVEIIEEFYKDNRTSFVFTSDHGMTDWGSHGEGTASETQTPFVAWGAGVGLPSHNMGGEHSPISWHLNKFQRIDMNQADMVPLISTLLGITIPVHSVGTLPLNILNISSKEASLAMLTNAKQILEQFIATRKFTKDNLLPFFYVPYCSILEEEEGELLQHAQMFMLNGNYEDSIKASKEILEVGLDALLYYHNYHQKMLLLCISATYLGWIFCLYFVICMDTHRENVGRSLNKKGGIWSSIMIPKGKNRRNFWDLFCWVITVVICILLYVQSLPLQFCIYCCAPFFVWRKAFQHATNVGQIRYCIPYLIGTELVVFSFFHRECLSVVICGICLWPRWDWKFRCANVNKLFVIWALSCVILSVFPLLPIIGGRILVDYAIFSVVMWFVFIGAFYSITITSGRNPQMYFFLGYFLAFVVSLFVLISISRSYEANHGLHPGLQILAWILLLSMPLTPVLGSAAILNRLANIFMALGCTSILFAVNYEVTFPLFLCCHFSLWLFLENKDERPWKHNVLLQNSFQGVAWLDSKGKIGQNFRLAFLYFFYTIFSFFGTGNIASVNSFDPAALRCFLTTFSPFTMMSLALVKIVIPFLITACAFRAVATISNASVDKIFTIVLLYCECMGLNFLFLVKNVGSWLEIGSSVSHFVIAQVMILFLILFYIMSGILTTFKLFQKQKYTKHHD